MPLRCLDATGDSIHSFDLSDGEWQVLAHENKKARHLRMPCCSAQVALKRSRLKTPFFAHIAREGCNTTSETEEHRYLKWLAVMAARNHGWTAETEVTESSPSGEPWRADVLARKGKYKVAIEVQWSKQADHETLRRQQRYKESGVRGVWLFRQSEFPINFDLPAVSIGGSLKGGFQALIPSYSGVTLPSPRGRWHQVLPMDTFLDVVFRRRFQFGIPASIEATVAIRTALMPCWQPACESKTRILTGIEVSFGPHECKLTVPELAKHPEVLRIVLNKLSSEPRYSTNLSQSPETRECIGCGKRFGQYFEQEAHFNQDRAHVLPIRLSQPWTDVLASRMPLRTWSAYVPSGDTQRVWDPVPQL